MNRFGRITGGAALFPLVVLFGLNAVDQLDRAAFTVLAPNIRDSFGLDIQGILTLTVLIIPMQFIVGVPIAYFADRSNFGVDIIDAENERAATRARTCRLRSRQGHQ